MAIWLVSIVWSMLPLGGIGSYRLEGMGTSCTFNYVDRSPLQQWFFLCMVTFNFFIPFHIIVCCYWRIFAYVKRVKRELTFLQRGSSNKCMQQWLAKQAEMKTAVTAIVIICLFCMAWTPYVIIAFVGLFGPEDSITPLISMFPNILAKTSTVSNPILYTIGHQEVRRKMRMLLFSSTHEPYVRPSHVTAYTSRGHSRIYNKNISTTM